MTAHAKLSPSASSRWLLCPGSPKEGGKPSTYAAEGTMYHELMSDYFEFGTEPQSRLGHKKTIDGFEIEVTKDMVGHALDGVDALKEVCTEINGPHFWVETKVPLDRVSPGSFGTCDIAWLDEGVLHIWDWKYGAGEPISPEENTQLMLYAIGFVDWLRTVAPNTEIRIRQVVLHIFQPRNPLGGGSWGLSAVDLWEFSKRAQSSAEAALAPDAPRVAGEKQCKFCPANATCGENAQYLLGVVGIGFEDLDAGKAPPCTEDLTPERRSHVLRHSAAVMRWLKRLKIVALEDALAGRPDPGWKAVIGGEGNRKWKDELEAISFFCQHLAEDDLLEPREIKSPAQIEKALGRKRAKELAQKITNLVTRPPGKPELVRDTDLREPCEGAAKGFTDLGASADDF